MILASHVVIGAAVSRLVPGNPYVGFLLGAASHFVADAIPHPEYRLSSLVIDKDQAVNMRWDSSFLFDLLRIGTDITTGIFISLFIFKAHNVSDLYALFVGVAGGILPDGLQFLYFKIKKEPLITIQKFHKMVHAKKITHRSYRNIFFHAAIVVAIVVVSILMRH